MRWQPMRLRWSDLDRARTALSTTLVRGAVTAGCSAGLLAAAHAQNQNLVTRLPVVSPPVLVEHVGLTEVARQRPDAVYGWIDGGLREPVDFSQQLTHPTLTIAKLTRRDRSLCIEIHRADGSYSAQAEIPVAPTSGVVEVPLNSSAAARAAMSQLPALAGELAVRVRAAARNACASKGPWLPARWGAGRAPEPRYLAIGAASLGMRWVRVDGGEAVPCEPLAQAIGRADLGGVVFSSLCPVANAPVACKGNRNPVNAKVLWMKGERLEAEADIRLIGNCRD